MATETGQQAAALTRFHNKHAALKTAMESAGINPERARKNIQKSCEIAGDLAAKIVTRTAGQAVHDNYTNLPCGIYNGSDYTPRRAVMTGLAGALGTFVEWDINAALDLCADILEDVNAHTESAKVREMIER